MKNDKRRYVFNIFGLCIMYKLPWIAKIFDIDTERESGRARERERDGERFYIIMPTVNAKTFLSESNVWPCRQPSSKISLSLSHSLPLARVTHSLCVCFVRAHCLRTNEKKEERSAFKLWLYWVKIRRFNDPFCVNWSVRCYLPLSFDVA